jgi:hypothetical protein
VKLKKLEVLAMDAIDPAAKTNCEILRRSPVKVPGVPGKSFILFLLSPKIQQSIRFLMGLRKNPSFPYPKSISHITQKQQLKTSQTHYSFQNSIKNMHKGPEIEYPEKNWRYFTTGKFDYCVKTTKERTWT